MDKKRTALIVDDSRVSRLLVRQFFIERYPDWMILEAGSGEEAIEKASMVEPFLVLIDVNMPGMGGLAAAEMLRKMYPNAHISLLTANVQDPVRKQAELLGIDFLQKPFNEKRISDYVEKLV